MDQTLWGLNKGVFLVNKMLVRTLFVLPLIAAAYAGWTSEARAGAARFYARHGVAPGAGAYAVPNYAPYAVPGAYAVPGYVAPAYAAPVVVQPAPVAPAGVIVPMGHQVYAGPGLSRVRENVTGRPGNERVHFHVYRPLGRNYHYHSRNAPGGLRVNERLGW